MTVVLETRDLQKSFGGLKVTRELSLKVEQGARHELAVVVVIGGVEFAPALDLLERGIDALAQS